MDLQLANVNIGNPAILYQSLERERCEPESVIQACSLQHRKTGMKSPEPAIL
jgi:hypothetical protein